MAAVTAAQAPERIATTADVLAANAVFFHGKRIVVRHRVRQTDRLAELEATPKPIYVFWRDRPAAIDGEIRGEFYDLGRMQEGDERFSTYDFRSVIDAANNGRWPGRDQVFVILGATVAPGPPASAPTVRSIVLTPEQFDDRSVTVIGRFKGRNLYGDLPQGVAKSKWDFVLQSADAAVWVTGLRPRGKDFDLDPGARVDTGRWLEVTGTVDREGGALWIAGEAVRLTAAPVDAPAEVAAVIVPAEPPPAVIFSAPLEGETDFPVASPVRIQFSRYMRPPSFENRVRVRYTGPNASPIPPPASTIVYDDPTRSLQIRFKEPLERLQTVTIRLDEGIVAADGQPLKSWTLTFSTGS